MKNQHTQSDSHIVVVMGVSGCGKSTVAAAIAKLLNGHFKDGDELHPEANIKKMESGIPLNDGDREPWLFDLVTYAREKATQHGLCVIACSALKQRYRDILNKAGNVVYIYLDGSFELIASRMHARKGHFMPEALLTSQFDALEDPRAEGNVVSVGIESDPQTIATDAVATLHMQGFLNNN